jgi:copper resistance protein B
MRRIRTASVVAALVFSAGVHAAVAQHEGHQPQKPAQTPATPGSRDHSEHQKPVPALPSFIPPVTEEDRKAAFPDVEGHPAHDRAANYFVLFDQLEWQAGKEGSGVNLDSKGWFGWDRDRLWFRAEGDGESGDVAAAEAQLFYGRQISRWWDLVVGVRQDFRPGPSRTFAAIGLQGLAPYWFEVEGTAYVGSSGLHFRGEIEYDLLFTNRLVLQPLLEVEIFGKSDAARGFGAGPSSMEAGFRLRYEFRRELAPYIGVTWNNKFGGTADFAEAAGEHPDGVRFATGLRLWF